MGMEQDAEGKKEGGDAIATAKKEGEENRGAATPRRVATDCGQEWQLVGRLCAVLRSVVLCNRLRRRR